MTDETLVKCIFLSSILVTLGTVEVGHQSVKMRHFNQTARWDAVSWFWALAGVPSNGGNRVEGVFEKQLKLQKLTFYLWGTLILAKKLEMGLCFP